LERIRAGTQRMSDLIDDLLKLSRIARTPVRRERVDLSTLANEVAEDLRRREPHRAVTIDVATGLSADGDRQLVRIVLDNLLGNAWKFTSKRPEGRIQFGVETIASGRAFFVRDNGAGFDMSYADKLFAPFQRLHKASEFDGTGIGLATVQRIITRHAGHLSAVGEADVGATFFFTLGENP
jgi:light-regulated signal transduction histidine kinase (bacteriophytochrome)